MYVMDKYILVWSEEQNELQKRVNMRIERWYICQWWVCVQMYQWNIFLIQAMILKDKQDETD